MTLAVVVKGPEGVVLAAESRLTLEISQGDKVHFLSYDHATKVLNFSSPNTHVGAVTFDRGVIDGPRTAASYVPEFEATLPTKRLRVADFAARLNEFFRGQLGAADVTSSPMSFLVAGFDPDEPYARVYEINVPQAVTPVEYFATGRRFGVEWRGQRGTVLRLFEGFDPGLPDRIEARLGLDPRQMRELRESLEPLALPIPWEAIGLQDCVDLAIFGIRSTITAQSLSAGLRGCGGAIDVAVVTSRDGLHFVQRKELRGERSA